MSGLTCTCTVHQGVQASLPVVGATSGQEVGLKINASRAHNNLSCALAIHVFLLQHSDIEHR